jgi:cytochrome c
VRGIAVSPDGATAMTVSFDQSAIRWTLATATAEAVLRGHEGAVNAVIALPDGGFATAGDDGRILLWPPGSRSPAVTIQAGTAPVAALALAPGGSLLASAGWDGGLRLWSLDGSPKGERLGHQGPVSDVAFRPDGTLASTGADATLRLWPADGSAPTVLQFDTPLHHVAAEPDGQLVVAGADGTLRFLDAAGQELARLEVAPTPVIALAISPDGSRLAAGGVRGSVSLVDVATRRVTASLVGPGVPVWSLAFTPDGKEILTGGADRLVRRWDAASGAPIGPNPPPVGEDPLAAFAGERGAEVFRACAACHTLTADGGNRAGPTLHGLFGRRIASVPDYPYSPGLKELDIVWNAETLTQLFTLGPMRYTPGTRMPEQTIGTAEDLAALIAFLRRATAD